MEILQVRSFVGDDGILTIRLPQHLISQVLDVVVVCQASHVLQTEISPKAHKMHEELGFSRQFLEKVIGAWESEPLECPERLPFTEREEIKWPTF